MSFPVESFWKLVVEGQLLSLDDCHRYHAAWAAQYPQGDAQQLAEWLFAQNVISRYQASILLAGRAGPFVYGDYKIYDRIESGRLKGIFRAIHIPTMHTVCLKFLTPEQSSSPETVAWLTQQAAHISLSSAGYPHLLRCYHLVDLGQFKFFVLEDLQGKRVERILHQKGPLPQSEACRIARQAALGLSRLHASQQAHGDVRPSNLWVDVTGTIKLMQFPLTRDALMPPDWRQLAADPNAAVPPEADYVAPELIAGGQPDARSDIYELGCSLYAMLTNRPPFTAKTLREKLEGHLKGHPAPIEQVNPSIAPALGKIVGYMMAKKPDMRYQQAATVIEKLLPFMTPADAQSQPNPPSPASQAYDAWLLERLTTQPQAPQAQPQAAPPMPAQAAMVPQAAMMPQPGMAAQGQPYGAQPYGAQPYGAQPYGAQPYAGQPYQQPAMMAPANPYGAQPQQYAAAPQSPAFAPAVSASVPEAPFTPPTSSESPRPGAAPPRPGAAPPRSFGPEPVRVKRNNSNVMFLVGLVGAALVLPVGYFIYTNMNSPTTPATPPKTTAGTTVKQPGVIAAVPAGSRPAAGGPKATASATAAVTAPATGGVVVRDTMTALGDPIWDSPTHGKPLALNYLPRGSSMIVAFRPAGIMQHEEAKRIYQENADPERKLRIIGRAGEWFETVLPQWTGTTLENIDQVVAGLLDGTDKPRIAYVIHLVAPVEEATVAQAWGNPAPEEVDGVKLYVRDGLACYVPSSAGGKTIVIAPHEETKDMLMLRGAPPQLSRRELDFMVQTTDADRHLNILYAPSYLISGGRPVVAGGLDKLVEPLNWLFTGVGLGPAPGGDGGMGSGAMPAMGDDAEPPKAVLVSAHFAKSGASEDLFWETRLYNGSASAVMESGVAPLAGRVKEVPQRVESYVLSLGLSPYSRAVLFKFPRMVKFLCDNVRAATADRQLVLRGYLPGVATHNVVLGTYLSLLESGGGMVTAVATTGGPGAAAPAKKLSALEILRTKKIALAFDRNDLNKVLDIVATEIGVPIEMHGDDFRDAGITKNQSMGLNEPEQTVDKLLQVILKKANLDGQLVYMVKPAADGTETILILTRKGAAARKETLLPEFEQAPVKK